MNLGSIPSVATKLCSCVGMADIAVLEAVVRKDVEVQVLSGVPNCLRGGVGIHNGLRSRRYLEV